MERHGPSVAPAYVAKMDHPTAHIVAHTSHYGHHVDGGYNASMTPAYGHGAGHHAAPAPQQQPPQQSGTPVASPAVATMASPQQSQYTPAPAPQLRPPSMPPPSAPPPLGVPSALPQQQQPAPVAALAPSAVEPQIQPSPVAAQPPSPAASLVERQEVEEPSRAGSAVPSVLDPSIEASLSEAGATQEEWQAVLEEERRSLLAEVQQESRRTSVAKTPTSTGRGGGSAEATSQDGENATAMARSDINVSETAENEQGSPRGAGEVPSVLEVQMQLATLEAGEGNEASTGIKATSGLPEESYTETREFAGQKPFAATNEDIYRSSGMVGTTNTMGLNIGFSTQTSFLGEDSDNDPFSDEETIKARRQRVAGIVQGHIQGQVSGKPEGYDGTYAPEADPEVSTKLFHGELMQAVEQNNQARRDATVSAEP